MTSGTGEATVGPLAARSIVSSVVGIVVITTMAAVTGGAMSLLFQTTQGETAATEGPTYVPAARWPKGWLVRALPPILTNLAGDRRAWVRLEMSVALPPELATEPVFAQIGQDTLTYLRTVKPEHIQGATDIIALREELEERIRMRTGKAGTVLFRSFVVE